MRIGNPFIMITHVIGFLREADVGSQSADTIKLKFRFQCPRRYARSYGRAPDHESACHLRREKETIAGNGVAANVSLTLAAVSLNIHSWPTN